MKVSYNQNSDKNDDTVSRETLNDWQKEEERAEG